MINKVILMGRLTADPELRQTSSNISVCRFTVAVNRQFQASNGERQADFINVVVWRQSAEFVNKYFRKGSMIIVEGQLRTNNYTDQQGNKRYSLEVHADNVTFGESKGSSGGNSSNAGTTQNTFQQPQYNNDNSSASLSIGNMDDFEEVLSDDELPF